MSDLLQTVRPMWPTVDAKAFSDALKKASAVLRKSAVPVLEEVCVRFSGGKCILTGTDLDTWIISELPAQGDDFAFIFSRTKKVERACRSFDGVLTLELAESGKLVRLSCGARIGEFDTYPEDGYPDVPKTEGDVSFSTNAASLMERIGKVAYATLKPGQSTRENAACVEFSGRQIFAVDGYRAAWNDGELEFPQPFLVHAAPLHHLKAFRNHQVEFRFSKPWLSVTDGNTTILFQTAGSEPFHLETAIPQKYLEEFSVSPREFLAELRYLEDVIPVTRTPYVHLRGNELFMLVSGKRYSAALAISRTGDTPVGLNLHYLSDALRQFKKEKRVTVKISGIHSPVVIEAENRSSCAMVLPVRVDQDAAA